MIMTHGTRTINDRTDDLRRASKTLADRIDAIANEMSRARGRLGKRFRRVEAAVAELDESQDAPNAKVSAALEDFAAEAKRSFERIVA